LKKSVFHGNKYMVSFFVLMVDFSLLGVLNAATAVQNNNPSPSDNIIAGNVNIGVFLPLQ